MSLFDRVKDALWRIARGRGADSEAPKGESEGSSGPGAALEAADLTVLASVRRCTVCRACDVAFSGYPEAARPVFRGPSELVTTYARRAPDHDAAKDYLKSLRRGDLEELERICPARIPFVALADLVERRAQALAPDDAPPEPTARPRHDPG